MLRVSSRLRERMMLESAFGAHTRVDKHSMVQLSSPTCLHQLDHTVAYPNCAQFLVHCEIELLVLSRKEVRRTACQTLWSTSPSTLLRIHLLCRKCGWPLST
eukprot:175034-Amphidinium_carterae.1